MSIFEEYEAFKMVLYGSGLTNTELTRLLDQTVKVHMSGPTARPHV